LDFPLAFEKLPDTRLITGNKRLFACLKGADEEVKSKLVERYVLARYVHRVPNPDRPLKRVFMFLGISQSLFALAVLIFQFRNTFYFAVMVLLIPLMVLLSIKKQHNEFKKSSELTDEMFWDKVKSKNQGFLWSVAPIVLAILILRTIENRQPELMPYIVMGSSVLLGLMSFFYASGNFHKLYLINKHCPYLTTFNDRQYYKDFEAVS